MQKTAVIARENDVCTPLFIHGEDAINVRGGCAVNVCNRITFEMEAG